MENKLKNDTIESLSDEQAYHQFLNDMKKEYPMKSREHRGFVEILRSHGRKLNRLMEVPVLEIQF